jgi:hypothetical protein
MKTIKLIALFICLFLGGFLAFAESKTDSQKLADILPQIEECKSHIRDAKSAAEVKRYSFKLDSLNDEYDKIVNRMFGNIDSKRAEIHQDAQNGKDVHELADKYLTPEKIAEYKKNIQTRKDRNDTLNRDSIPAYKAHVKEELNNFITNVNKNTGFKPIVDLKTVQRDPNYAEGLNNYIIENLSAYGLTPTQKKEVQQQYDQLVNAKEKVIKAQQEFKKNQDDIAEFCNLCQGQCGCQ